MKLKKHLGTFELFSYAAGISSGLFILPAIVYKEIGPACVLAYFFAGLLILPAIFTKAELATAMPLSGGSYLYSERILGSSAGIIVGFSNWISISLKSAFALIGIGAFFSLIYPEISLFQVKILSSLFAVFFMILNIFFLSSNDRLQLYLFNILLIILFIYILTGYPETQKSNYKPFFEKDYKSIIEMIGVVFISFSAIPQIANMAEEIKNPGKVLPKAMFYSFIVTTTIYCLVILVTIGLLDKSVFSNTLTPISLGAKVIFGRTGLVIMSIGAILAFITTANSAILGASRILLAMSRDSLLPIIFSNISKKFHTPYISIIFTTIFMIFIILFLSIENLAKVASAFLFISFIMDNFTLIVVRYSQIINYRPTFTSPLFPWMQIFAILLYSILIFQMGLIIILITFLFIIFTYFWFKFYGLKRDKKDTAFIKVVEKILNKNLISNEKIKILENELLDILRHREGIIEDRFDKLIKHCKIIDLNQCISRDEFFKIISKELSEDLNIDENVIYEKFIEREKISTTHLHFSIAIPHIIVEGKNKFDIILVRNKEGIDWDDNKEKVKAVFVLIGSIDERNYHLRALMAIAQIVYNEGFINQWLNAKNIDDLRSIILLSNRKREHN